MKCYDKAQKSRRSDRDSGLDSLEYEVSNIHHMTIEDIPFVVVNVKLKCDKSLTPWCDCKGATAPEKGKGLQV
jgi:xylosylprotein 4-beta-galactosyltransferase